MSVATFVTGCVIGVVVLTALALWFGRNDGD